MKQHTSIYGAPDIVMFDKGSKMSAAVKDSVDWKVVMGGITMKGYSGKLYWPNVSGEREELREPFRWPNTP